MTTEITGDGNQELSFPVRPYVRRVLARIVRMTLAWVVLGSLMGGYAGWDAGGGTVRIISFGIAGQIVLGFVGFGLGCFVDRGIESLVGGLTGFLFGAIMLSTAEAFGQVPPATVTLVIGALLGATALPFISAITRVVHLSLKRASLLVTK